MARAETVVLIHGLTIARQPQNTFVGVPEALMERGFRVHRTTVRGGGSLSHLADRVWQQIAGLDGPLLLLCHSMGGLQARTFLLDDTKARRLSAIVTVGSPHGGAPFPSLMSPFDPAYAEMTVAARARWETLNGEAERASAARHGVRCLSVVASLDGAPGYRRLTAPHRLLQSITGANDGLVPATSQGWGELAFTVNLDHLECACVNPPSRRASQCVDLWVRMAERARGARSHADSEGVQ